jgi:hypothetical protein
LTPDFSTWVSDNTGVAKVSYAKVQGVAAGSTTGYADGLIPVSGACACNLVPAETDVPITVQMPTYFGPTGFAAASGACPEGAVGTFIGVSDQVLDQNGSLMQISGITPEELVCTSALGCQPSYKTFSTP